MENPYTGEVPLQVGDKKGTLVYNMAAVSKLRQTYSNHQLQNELADLPPEDLCNIAAVGLEAKNSDITAKHIMEANIPIYVLAKAIDRALLFAYHGPDDAKKILEELAKAEEKLAEMAEAEKKSRK